MDRDHLPVLIGVSRITEKSRDAPLAPSTFLAKAVGMAIKDAMNTTSALSGSTITDIITVRTAVEDAFRPGTPLVAYKNLPQQIATLVGIEAETQRYWHTSSGGNTPQLIVNMFSEKISKGEASCVIISGCELLSRFQDQIKATGAPPEWGGNFEEPHVTRPVNGILGKVQGDVDGCNDVERKNGLVRPRQMYPLLEMAYRAQKKRTVSDHLEKVGQLFEKLNEVAGNADNRELAWFPQKRTANEISTESPSNRWIAFPYTKYMNAVMRVNQAACVILASNKVADQLGVPQEKRVYLRSCADAIEPGYYVSPRPNLGTSHAMVECLETALKRAGLNSRDIDLFDLYSCFPIAVEVACDFLNIDIGKDKRPITVTGGLPYYGGPGNAYVVCSIAAMVEQLRKRPVGQFGLVTANGWFLTKHSCGIYSRAPPEGKWEREDPKLTQARADKRAGQLIAVEEAANGEGIVEAYIVDLSDKKRKPKVLAVGRVVSTGKRFVASSKADDVQILRWLERDGIGMRVRVTTCSKGLTELEIMDENDWKNLPLSGVPLPTGMPACSAAANSKM